MKIKRSLAILFVVIIFCIVAIAVVFVAATVANRFAANEQWDFTPLISLIVLLTAVLLCLVALAVVQVRRFRKKKKLMGQSYYALNVALARQGYRGYFDFNQLETPFELLDDYSEQSNLVVEKAILRLSQQADQVQQQQALQALYMPRHFRGQSDNLVPAAPLPHIRLVPEMKHAPRRKAEVRSAQVPMELENLLRKIS